MPENTDGPVVTEVNTKPASLFESEEFTRIEKCLGDRTVAIFITVHHEKLPSNFWETCSDTDLETMYLVCDLEVHDSFLMKREALEQMRKRKLIDNKKFNFFFNQCKNHKEKVFLTGNFDGIFPECKEGGE